MPQTSQHTAAPDPLGDDALSAIRAGQPAPGERRPALLLASVAAAGVLAAGAAIYGATQPGWLGARLEAAGGNCVRIAALAPDGPLARAGARVGDCLTALEGDEGAVATDVDDMIEDPDQFTTRAAQSAYYARQSALARALSMPSVAATLRAPDGATRQVEATLRPRPLATFPATFWVTIVSALVGLIIGAWVWVLRRSTRAAAWLGWGGVSLFVAAMPTAVYSSRELAVDGALQGWFSACNHLGATLLGLSTACFFLDYPDPVGPRWLRAALFAAFGGWLAADLARAIEPLGFFALSLAVMASVVAAWAAQAYSARRKPAKRAALSWFGVAALFGVTASTLGSLGPIAFGAEPLMSQGFLFAFFTAFFGTVAVGVRSHHIFDLGRWAYRILFYAVGAATMVALDAALVYGLNFERNAALMASIMIVALVYLPIRDVVWRRYATPGRVPAHEFFGDAMDVAFGADASEQDRRWRGLLRHLFDPLEIERAREDAASPYFSDGRVELTTPAVAGSPPLRLRYPYGGKALFADVDATLVARLVELVRRAERARDDYGRGVLEERARIARDLHDDLGARLLAGAVSADSDARALSQAALRDLRSILADLSAAGRDLDEGLANLRQETAERAADVGLRLDWPPIEESLSRHKIDPRQMKALASSVRESVSNAIRHSGGGALAVRATVDCERLRVVVRDDGGGLEPAGMRDGGEGLGLRNMRERMAAAEGDLRVDSSAAGVSVTFELPLRRSPTRRSLAP